MPDQHSPQERRWTIRRTEAPSYPTTVSGFPLKIGEEIEVIPAAALQDREAELGKELQTVKAFETAHCERANKAEARTTVAKERADRAEAALKPFAEVEGSMEAEEGEEVVHGLRVKDFRNARRVLDTSIEDREPEEQQQVGERCGGSGLLPHAMTNFGGNPFGDPRECPGCPDCKPPAPEKCTYSQYLLPQDCPVHGTGTKPPTSEECPTCGVALGAHQPWCPGPTQPPVPVPSGASGDERDGPVWAWMSRPCAIRRHDQCDGRGQDGGPCNCSCHVPAESEGQG